MHYVGEFPGTFEFFGQQTQELKTLRYFRLKHVYVKGSQTHVLSQAGPSMCNRRRKSIKQLNSEKHNVWEQQESKSFTAEVAMVSLVV